MSYVLGAYSDVGIKKRTNEDSVLAIKAQTDAGEVALAAVCDGMGGFARGELASATVIRGLDNWFCTRLAGLAGQGITAEAVEREWRDMIIRLNAAISSYGDRNGMSLGTTMVAVLLYGDKYIVCNIGDSRAYKLGVSLELVTKDHSFVQREIDAGRMTEEEALVSNKRNVILQCVGASADVHPDFFAGQVEPGDRFVLCSDGFRHVISSNEIFEYLGRNKAVDEASMRAGMEYLTELNKYRAETDNISVAMAAVY